MPGSVPIPRGPSNLHGPLELPLCAGLVFFLANIAIVIQTHGHANAIGELSPETPRWIRAVQYLISLTVFACFGAIGSWVAFGAGERYFPFMVGDAATNVIIGRAAFGVGAVLIWLCTAAIAASGIRRFFDGQVNPRADNCA